MKRNYLKTLLFGALVTASAGTFVSCNYDDDIDALNNRVTVVEGLIGELKTAIAAGASVTDVTTNEKGEKVIVLSNGQSITLSAGVKITDNADNVVINVEGKDYVLPKGAAAASLIYRPVYSDGKEIINDMRPILVSFLISGDVFDASKITEATIVDAYALTTRAAADLLEVVEGSAKVEGNVVTVSIKACDALEAGKTYNANVRIKVGSKEYISNYFQVQVGDGFIYDNAAPQDQIDAFAAADGMNATVGEDGATKLIVFNDELASMEGEVDFAKYFKGLPEGAKFLIGTQTSDEGKQAFDALRNSMGRDGKFSWKQRPGTAFPNGFRVTVQNKDGQTIGKADFKYTDPLAAIDFYDNGLPGNFEAEMGGNDFVALQLGAQTVDIQKAFMNYTEQIPMRHTGDAWFEAWAKYKILDADGNPLIMNDGSVLAATDVAKKYTTMSRGIVWFYRGLTVNVPSDRFPEGWDDPNGGHHDPGEGAGLDWWGGQPWDYMNGAEAFYAPIAKYGFTIDEKNGRFTTGENYTGWGMRVSFCAFFEYDYGIKAMCAKGADQFGMLFFNRRLAPEGTTIPADIIFPQ